MVHPLKRARLMAASSKMAPPTPASLVKARILLSVPSPDEGSFSPGTVFGCRLAVQTPSDKSKSGNVGTNVFLASGRSVYRTSVPAPVAGDLAKGKEGVLIPKVYEEPVKGHRLEFVQHIAEIQSINMVERNETVIVGSIDSLGRASVFHLGPLAGSHVRADSEEAIVPTHIYQLVPSLPVREPGWAGIALSRHQPEVTATAQLFSRTLVFYDGQIPVRTIGLHSCPTSLRFLPADFPGCASGAVLAMSLGHQVAVWDVRAPGQGALVAEFSLTASTGRLYDVQVSEAGRQVIGAAGADRTVGIWEPRKWTYVSRWNNCLKYEVHHLHFSTLNPEYCYVAGADYEVLCGIWSKDQRKGGGARSGRGTGHNPEGSDPGDEDNGEKVLPMAFRGDARWLGISRAQDADVLAGLSSSGHVFVAALEQKVAPSPQ